MTPDNPLLYCQEINEPSDNINNTDIDNELSLSSKTSLLRGEEMQQFMNNNTVFTDNDPSLNQIEDNINNKLGFFTANSGLTPVNINQDPSRDTVTSHVIFNQIGTFTSRRTTNIDGTSRQKYLIQKLCSTLPGQSSPL